MRKATHFQTSPLVTAQDVVHVLVLIAISLLFGLVPRVSFGQSLQGIPLQGNDMVSALNSMSTLAPPMLEAQEPAAASLLQATTGVPATAISFESSPEPAFAMPAAPLPSTSVPMSATATASPATANSFLPIQAGQSTLSRQTLPQNSQREIAVAHDHPFRQYLSVPNDPQTKITGKPMTVTELFTGTRSPAVRCQLLQAYWELSGLLAIYHFRCESERLASRTTGGSQEGLLFSEQRRTAEIEFIKQQWVMAELLKQYKGRTLRESELPIPVDAPLYPRYQTHAGLLARTERTQYLGRMIPIQEQLIESKHGTWKAASEMAQSASQPFFTVSTQRTVAFLDLTKAVIEYNKMIAEYALETIPPHVGQQQLVGAVVRLPRAASAQLPQPPQTFRQTTTENVTFSQYDIPAGITAQPVKQVAHEFLFTDDPPPPSLVPPPYEPETTETLSEPSIRIRDTM